jgi:transketolase
MAIGETVYPALSAGLELEARGISCRVISMHTLKPLDVECILKAATATRGLITVEEHSVHGGLGEACAAVLAQKRSSLPFRIVGIPDEATVNGSQIEIFEHYGISTKGLVETALQILSS